MSTSERILFLYLPTGGGHISAARALASEIQSRYEPGAVEVFLLDAFSPQSRLQRTLVEGGYQFSTLKAPWLWPIIYRTATLPFVMWFHTLSMRVYSAPIIRRFIRKHNITRVVNLHFLLTKSLFRALRQLKRLDMPAVTVVTDPFTAHPLWFYSQFTPLVTFSQRAARTAKRFLALYRRRGVGSLLPKPSIAVLPPILNPRYSRPLPHDRAKALKSQYGYDTARRLVVITGGGEGLPRGEEYFRALAQSEVDVDVAMVCGKNKALAARCEAVNKTRARSDHRIFRIYGFVDFMYELLNMADVAVIKAGPATIFECLMLEKPLIITQRLYGQEQGNVDFVIRNGLGWYEPDPRGAAEVVRQLSEDPAAFAEIRKRIRSRRFSNGTGAIADYILRM